MPRAGQKAKPISKGIGSIPVITMKSATACGLAMTKKGDLKNKANVKMGNTTLSQYRQRFMEVL